MPWWWNWSTAMSWRSWMPCAPVSCSLKVCWFFEKIQKKRYKRNDANKINTHHWCKFWIIVWTWCKSPVIFRLYEARLLIHHLIFCMFLAIWHLVTDIFPLPEALDSFRVSMRFWLGDLHAVHQTPQWPFDFTSSQASDISLAGWLEAWGNQDAAKHHIHLRPSSQAPSNLGREPHQTHPTSLDLPVLSAIVGGLSLAANFLSFSEKHGKGSQNQGRKRSTEKRRKEYEEKREGREQQNNLQRWWEGRWAKDG